jgi:hypothetical protein
MAYQVDKKSISARAALLEGTKQNSWADKADRPVNRCACLMEQDTLKNVKKIFEYKLRDIW